MDRPQWGVSGIQPTILTQGNLGNALMRLGERESGTARLEEAVTAYREALQEPTVELGGMLCSEGQLCKHHRGYLRGTDSRCRGYRAPGDRGHQARAHAMSRDTSYE
jgi:hypothetical protein